MATFRQPGSALSKFFLGNKAEATENVENTSKSYLELMDKLRDRQGGYRETIGSATNNGAGNLGLNYRAQGLLDSGGKLLSAKDRQGEFLDTDYLQQFANTADKRKTSAVSEGREALLTSKLQGRTPSVSEAIGALDTIKEKQDEALLGTMKQESELAYTKALTDIANKSAYSDKLTNDERQAAIDYLTTQMTLDAKEKGMSQDELTMAQNELANADDGFIMKFLGAALDISATAVAPGIVKGIRGLFGDGKSSAGAVPILPPVPVTYPPNPTILNTEYNPKIEWPR